MIVENGEPKAVLMDYEEFEKLVTPGIVDNLVRKVPEIERVNKEVRKAQLQDLREEVIQPDMDVISEDVVADLDEGITIEPLDRY